MTIAKVDLAALTPRLIPVALTGMLICGSWAVAQDPFGEPVQPASVAPAARAAAAKQPTKPTAPATADKQPIPSLEQLLARTLTGHPRIVAARSKVQLAEAELKMTRFEVAREQIELWNNWSWATHVFEEADALYRSKAAPAGPAIEAQAKLAALEAEIRQLLADSAESPSGTVATEPRSPVHRIPQGPMAEKIREALAKPVELDFLEEPLAYVVDYFKDRVTMGEMLVDIECGQENVVTLSLPEVPLVAAIQAIEDACPEVRFVVREYGIFVTTKGSPVDLESISAVDFWLETAGKTEKVQPKR